MSFLATADRKNSGRFDSQISPETLDIPGTCTMEVLASQLRIFFRLHPTISLSEVRRVIKTIWNETNGNYAAEIVRSQTSYPIDSETDCRAWGPVGEGRPTRSKDSAGPGNMFPNIYADPSASGSLATMNDGVSGDERPAAKSDDSLAKEDDVAGGEAPQQGAFSPFPAVRKMTYAEATKEGMRTEKLGNKRMEFPEGGKLQDGELNRRVTKRLADRAHGGGA